MKIKSLFIVVLACASIIFSSCSKEEDDPVVGIVSGTVTPLGSSIAYKLEPKSTNILENTNDSVAWDVTNTALSEATVKLTPTLEATVLYNNQPVGAEGVVINATSGASFTVKGPKGKTVTYTLNVVRAKNVEEGFRKKASSFNGLPAKIAWMDVTIFKDKFYALVISTKNAGSASEDVEELYQLFSSVDGLTWTEIPYTVAGKEDVIGGEGARLITFKNKLYVCGGMRTLGKDKFGNPAEKQAPWGGGSLTPYIKEWRLYASTDGSTFESLLEKTKIKNGDKELTALEMSAYNNPYATIANTGEYLLIRGGYTIGFGMMQGASNMLATNDGVNWTVIKPTITDKKALPLPTLGTNMFTFKGKFYIVGGFSSYITSENMGNAVYSSTDGITWDVEAESVDGFKNLYQSRAIANNDVIYLFGGEMLGEDGSTRTLSNVVYRSTDAIHWKPLITPKSFVGTRYASSGVIGDAIWFFGGYNNISTGYYAAPSTDDVYGSDTWNAVFK